MNKIVGKSHEGILSFSQQKSPPTYSTHTKQSIGIKCWPTQIENSRVKAKKGIREGLGANLISFRKFSLWRSIYKAFSHKIETIGYAASFLPKF